MQTVRCSSTIPDPALADAPVPTEALFNAVLATTRTSGNQMQQAVPLARLERLIAARAWTDAALALLALRLPTWQMRRLAFDDGEWHCALSASPAMPEWLDATVESHHPTMALAVLSAVTDAVDAATPRLVPVAASTTADAAFEPVPCENFA